MSTRSGDGTGAAGPDTVGTDDSGAFSLDYHLSGTLPDGSAYEGQRGVYRVTVRDGSGTVLARTTFSDAGGYRSCALTDGGGVKCWGYNIYGQLGDGTITNRWAPGKMINLAGNVSSTGAGEFHTCAVLTTGAVQCWGHNNYGQLGDGTTVDRTLPVQVAFDTTSPTTLASPAGGTYYSVQTVSLSTSEPATIYYTVDGSVPTTNSAAYGSPLNISSTTTLKYFARDAAGNSENIRTEVYTITLPTATVVGTPVSPTNVTMTLTNDATLTWQWKTQYWFSATAGAGGSVEDFMMPESIQRTNGVLPAGCDLNPTWKTNQRMTM